MEAKPFASLSSGLLARKGQAKPAMRPQGFAGFGMAAAARDDLGWNDMGYDVPPAPVQPVDPVPLAMTPLPVAAAAPAEVQPIEAPVAEAAVEAAVLPIVRAERPARRAPRRAAIRPATLPADQLRADHGRKAAFTLRLDGDRHLRLRLASAVRNRSAQQIVTEALDQFLAAMPELDELAGHVPARAAS